jgi:hypothetical protein
VAGGRITASVWCARAERVRLFVVHVLDCMGAMLRSPLEHAACTEPNVSASYRCIACRRGWGGGRKGVAGTVSAEVYA